MTIYCLCPQVGRPDIHDVYRITPAGRYPPTRLGRLRRGYGTPGEDAAWVVRDVYGYCYGGETAEAALAAFDDQRPRGAMLEENDSACVTDKP